MPKIVSTNNFSNTWEEIVVEKIAQARASQKNRKQKQTQEPQILELSDIDYKTMLGIFKEIKDGHTTRGNRNHKFW